MTETKSIIGVIAFLVLGFVGIYLISTERDVAAIVVFALMGSLFGLFLWRVFAAKRSIKKGDLCFVKKDFDGAKVAYLSALKSKNWEGENPNDKDTAELCTKLTLLQLSRGAIQFSDGLITSDVEFYLQKAIAAYPKYCFKDVQQLALRFDVQLTKDICETFRKSELQHFEKLLSSPRQEDMFDAYFIELGHPVLSQRHIAQGYLEYGTAIVRASVSPLPVSSVVKNLEVQLDIIPNRSRGRRKLPIAFSSAEAQSLTDTAIEELVADMELRSSIINGIGKHLLYVVKSFLRFAKNRYTTDEVAKLVVRLQEYVPVYWYEHAPARKLDVLVELAGPTVVGRYYIHGWNHSVMAELLFDINLEQLLKPANISDTQMKALCSPQTNDIQWQIIENEVWRRMIPLNK